MSSFDLLHAALTAADVRAALQAAHALAEQPGGLPLPRLAEALRAPQPALVRRAAVVHGALGPLARANLPDLIASLDHARWTVREAVVAALACVAPQDADVTRAFVQLALFDRTAAVRDAVVVVLARRPEGALAGVRPALAHIHPRVRCRALAAFTQLAQPADAAIVLAQALGDSHFRVRRDAAGLLGGLGAAALPSVPRLARCRFDGELRVAHVAARTAARIADAAPAEPARWIRLLLNGSDDPVEVLRSVEALLPPRPLCLAGRGVEGEGGRRSAAHAIARFFERLLGTHQDTTR